METKIVTIAIMICLIGISSAYYPGDTITIENEMGIDNLIYTVIGNSSPINISVEINPINITVTLPSDITPDSFTLVFLENTTHEIIKEVKIGGGSSGRTKYVDRNVTVVQPLFLDRNITNEIQLECEEDVCSIEPEKEEKDIETKNYESMVYGIAVIILLSILGWLYWRKKKNG